MNKSARNNSRHKFTVLGLAILLLIPGFWFQARPTNSAVEPQGIVYVSGEVPAGTTWTSNNVYVVTGDISVFDLMIQPGTTVRFDPGTYMWVRGPLLAIGTPANRITFTSNAVNPAPGDWGHNFEGGIFFPNCDDSSIIEYAVIEYGKGIGIINCAPRILNNVIRNNFGYTANGSAITARHDGYPTMRIIIRGNQIITNTGSYGCSGGGAIAILSGVAEISDNRIIGNSGGCAGGITFQSLDRHHIGSLIERNIIWSNTGYTVGGIIAASNDGYISYPGGNLTIRNNSIANNLAIVSDSSQSQWQSAGGLSLGSPELVENNSIINNVSQGVYPGDDNGGIVAMSRSSAQTQVRFNNLSSPSENYVAAVIGSRDVDFTNNFWGTSDINEIAAKIYDGNDHWALGIAHFEPFASTPITSAPAFLWDLSLESGVAGNGRMVTFDLSFSRAMEQTIHPVVTFGRFFPFSAYLVSTDAQWIDNSHWRATFDTSLVPCGSYTISVSGAHGSDGLEAPPNTQHYLRIDTDCKAYVPIVFRH